MYLKIFNVYGIRQKYNLNKGERQQHMMPNKSLFRCSELSSMFWSQMGLCSLLYY